MKRIVIKVGSAVLTQKNCVAKERMQNLVNLIVDLKQKYEVILVSSGAVSAGYTELQLDKAIVKNKQALAAIGQPLLMRKYKRKFEVHNIIVAQILVTSVNFHTLEQAKRVKGTIDILLENGVVPIVNENDATATEELELGDNDQLSAYAAHHFNAELLVILSDIDAYYDKDPNRHDDAQIRLHVKSIDKAELEREVTPNNEFATGGIVTKLKAGNYMLKHGKSMYLASGFDLSDVRAYLLDNKHQSGTLFSKEVF
ncbi:MAG: glutamate 5-kinase [Campylobacterota bacterium]|nr:glutamate 5-kinase [Campylobacterota bacterium]